MSSELPRVSFWLTGARGVPGRGGGSWGQAGRSSWTVRRRTDRMMENPHDTQDTIHRSQEDSDNHMDGGGGDIIVGGEINNVYLDNKSVE